jgi:hypothetical protein
MSFELFERSILILAEPIAAAYPHPAYLSIVPVTSAMA